MVEKARRSGMLSPGETGQGSSLTGKPFNFYVTWILYARIGSVSAPVSFASQVQPIVAPLRSKKPFVRTTRLIVRTVFA